MNITSTPSRIRTVHSSDDDFYIKDGLMIAPRAGFEVDINCPREYKLIIADCIERGWLRSVANVKDHQKFWEAFDND